ncbi:MAG: UDP-2,3-diacylglucosamine diphosphatase [Paracoccaceae bacterium]
MHVQDTAETPDVSTEAGKGRVRKVRAMFLSDFHLGTIGCKDAALLDFLLHHDADITYLVGDIFDHWRPLGAHWTAGHDRILKLLLERARAGRRIVYLPGNHDAFFHRYLGRYFIDLEVCARTHHTTENGLRLLVTHGDCCDLFAKRLPRCARAGSAIEAGVRRIDRGLNTLLRRIGRDKWNGIETALSRVNAMIRAHDRFEERLSHLARIAGADGIVCGHFHEAALHRAHGVLYANCGDWIESCTGLVERLDGTLELVRWQDDRATGEATEPEPADESLQAVT